MKLKQVTCKMLITAGKIRLAQNTFYHTLEHEYLVESHLEKLKTSWFNRWNRLRTTKSTKLHPRPSSLPFTDLPPLLEVTGMMQYCIYWEISTLEKVHKFCKSRSKCKHFCSLAITFANVENETHYT